MEQKSTLPNSAATLVLGILSIVFCWCYGIIGVTLGIIALAISNGPKKLYLANPGAYEGYQNLKAGRVCAIIGICLSSLTLIYIIVYILVIGSIASLSLDSLMHHH
jgi:hypothetical protein